MSGMITKWWAGDLLSICRLSAITHPYLSLGTMRALSCGELTPSSSKGWFFDLLPFLLIKNYFPLVISLGILAFTEGNLGQMLLGKLMWWWWGHKGFFRQPQAHPFSPILSPEMIPPFLRPTPAPEFAALLAHFLILTLVILPPRNRLESSLTPEIKLAPVWALNNRLNNSLVKKPPTSGLQNLIWILPTLSIFQSLLLLSALGQPFCSYT